MVNGFRMFDQPVDPDLPCHHCPDHIVALGVDERHGDTYLWAHLNGSAACRPTTKARPYDPHHAHLKVRAVEAERIEQAELLLDAAFAYVEVGR